MASAFIACSFASCEKCFNCSIPSNCGHCRYMNGSLDIAVCQSDNLENYQMVYTDCMAQGGSWIILDSTPDVTPYCYTSTNTTAINSQESVCENAGGKWSSK